MIFRKMMKTLFLLLIAAGIAGTAGCVKEYGGEPLDANADEVTITVNVPGQHIPSTRSIAGASGEAAVKTIDVLIFKSDGTLTEHVAGTNISQSTSSADNYKVSFKALLNVDSNAATVVVLANVANVATTIDGLTAKKDILAALTHSSTGKWNATSSSSYTAIPMYGEKAVSGIASGTTIEGVELTRMLARIDVVNNATSKFTVSNVYLVNYNTKGYVAPAWKSATGVLESTLPTAPMIPASPGTQTGEANALDYTYSGSGLLGEIYTFEAVKTSGEEGNVTHTNAICLIVKGTLSGDATPYYYRVDFTDTTDGSGKAPGATGFDPYSVEYVPVFRNHLYKFEITAVNGSGYGSFDDALKSLGVMNNLQTTLHVVNQAGIINMVYDGQHYIGLGDDVTFSFESGLEANVPCITSYTYGWQIDTSKGSAGIEYVSGGTGWLQATQSTDKNNVDLKTLTVNSSDIEPRVAYVYVKAAELTNKVMVTQEVVPYFPAYPGVIGYDPETGMLNLDGKGEMMYFKFGSVVGSVCPVINGFTWNNRHVHFNPSDLTVGTGGDITTYSTVPVYGSADWNGNLKNVSDAAYHNDSNVKLGKGDPCKLIGLTVDQIKAGNVDNGKWRLPTVQECIEFTGMIGAGYNIGYNDIIYPNRDLNGAIGTDPSFGYFPVGGGTTIEENTGRFLNTAGIALPAAGYYTASGVTGVTGAVGATGRYRSSVAISSTLAGHMAFGYLGLFPYTRGEFSPSYPIRCVPNTQLTVDKEALEIDYKGAAQTVKVYTNNPGGWYIDEATLPSWITITPASGSADASTSVQVSCEVNKDIESKSGSFWIIAGSLSKEIKITQEDGLLYVGRFGGELVVNAYGEYSFTKELWIQAHDESSGIAWTSSGTTYATTATGVTDKVDGRGNTFNLVQLDGANLAAAYLCFSKNPSANQGSASGLIWYLPAQKQLMAAWVSQTSYATAYRPSSSQYWISAEENDNYAWYMTFENGYVGSGYPKISNDSFSIRCVREYSIN